MRNKGCFSIGRKILNDAPRMFVIEVSNAHANHPVTGYERHEE
jgi:hypothetical protein